ncbi:hypothetical protein [Nocardia farcinica]|uniref:hypothetical protein n=1 Tax=Nocardia farcinica TaxID=37329 RepID=UPI0037B6A801
MTDLHQWEEQLQRDLAEIRRNGEQLTETVAAIRGRCEARGVSIEVNADGDITALHIAPGAMKWSSSQLAGTLADCHRKAKADAVNKARTAVHRADPRIEDQLRKLREIGIGRPQPQAKPLSEEEIQADDDAYYERINRGWIS